MISSVLPKSGFALLWVMLVSLFVIGCSANDVELREELSKNYSDGTQLYRVVNIENAEKILKHLEDILLSHESDQLVYGSKDVSDCLYATRLRLWGIYQFTQNEELTEKYANKIFAMKNVDRSSIDEDWLRDELERVDIVASPQWISRDQEKWFERMSIDEMQDAGHIRRVD